MRKPPKIDITKSVMSQIESGQVKMRPKAYFTAKKIIKFAGLIFIVLVLLMAIFYAVIIIQNGVFKEYLEFGKQGAAIYWSSLPWGAIVISVLLTAVLGLGIYLVQQKKRLVPSMIGVLASVALVTALVFKVSPDPNNSALARAVVGVDGNPTKIAGTVEERSTDGVKIKTSSGEIFIIKIGENTLGDKSFEVGDELLVLGSKQDGSISADAIKTTKKSEKKVVEVKQEQPTKTEPETKPTDEPKPEQKPVSSPVIKPTTPVSPPPEPVAFNGYINASQDSTYVYVTFNLNQANSGKCIAHFKQGATLVTTSYTVLSSPGSVCTVKIKKADLGSTGTWNIDAYFKYPYSDWSQYINKQSTITI